MRPAPVPPQWRKISAASTVRRRLKSKTPHTNPIRRLLAPQRFSKWLSSFAQRFTLTMTLDRQTSILAAMQSLQTPVAELRDDLQGLVCVQTAHPELLLLPSLPRQIDIDTRQSIQEQKEDAGLADKAVAWMLAPVFFCCVVTEKAKPPQTWEATEVFSQVVVSFMLKLFVLATDLTSREQQNQGVKLEKGN